MGVGAAMTGLRPIVEGMNMGFLLLAFSQISNNAGMLHYTSGGNFKVPMVIRGPGGASAAFARALAVRPNSDRCAVAAQASVASWARSTRSASSPTSRPSRVRSLSPAGPRRQATDMRRLRNHRCSARRLQHARECEGAAEVGHPQRQPHRVLRGALRSRLRRTPIFTTLSPDPSRVQHVLLYNVKGVTYNDYLQPLERAEMVREGNQVTILTYSRMRCVLWHFSRRQQLGMLTAPFHTRQVCR